MSESDNPELDGYAGNEYDPTAECKKLMVRIKELEAEKTRLLKLMIEFKDCAHRRYKKGNPMLCPQCIDAINREIEVLEDKP